MTHLIRTLAFLFVVSVLVCSCVDTEPPWDSPPAWRAEFWTVEGLAEFTQPIGIDGIRETDGTPEDVAAAMNDAIRWRDETHDYWQSPAETLAHGFGDCEDLECLAIAVLRRDGDVAGRSFAVARMTPEKWHVWIDLGDGRCLDCRGPHSRPMQVVPASSLPEPFQTTSLKTEPVQ